MQRPAVIFDFGNVIAFFDFKKVTAELGLRFGVTSGELLSRLDAAGFAGLHAEFEHGRIGAEVFSQRFADLVGLKVTHEQFTLAWGNIFSENASILPIIAEIKTKGHRLILGSNTNSIHAQKFRSQFRSTVAFFDQLILSHEIGVMKPHREFYLACATAANLPPTGCIFVDDLIANIAGAEAVGMQGLVYQSSENLRAQLCRLGILGER